MAVDPVYMILDEVVSLEEFQRHVRAVNKAFLKLNKAYARGQAEPWPLCIDGREYHRRQRRRGKRKGAVAGTGR